MTDKITWHISPQTLRTDLRAKALEKAILEACPDAEANDARTFTLILSCTSGVEFDATTARAALHTFKQFVATYQGMSPAEVWAYRMDMPLHLWYAWLSAFNDGQNLFDTDPAELPTSALTEEQRREAETPGSPLISPAPNSSAA